MQKNHARLLFVLSIFLLSLVVIDFVRIGDKTSQQKTSNKPKINVTEKVSEIGEVFENSSSVLAASASAIPIIRISEPANNFETNSPKATLKGTVSDPTATVSAKLNQRFLGKLKVATNGAFEKELNLDEGLNKIILSALGANYATASATLSGTLLKDVNISTAPLNILLAIITLLAISFLVWSFKHLKKNRDKKTTGIDSPATK